MTQNKKPSRNRPIKLQPDWPWTIEFIVACEVIIAEIEREVAKAINEEDSSDDSK